MAGYSTVAPGATQIGPQTTGERGGYSSPGVYRMAGRPELVGPRDYQYSLDPAIEADLQTIYGDIAGAQQAELGGIRDFIGSLEGAEQRGLRSIDAGIGQGIAAARSAPGGRLSPTQLRAAGLEGGLAKAAYQSETIPAILQARYESQGLLAKKTQEIDAARSARIQEVQDMVTSLKDKHSNFFETDTNRVAEDLMAQARFEVDPHVRQWMIAEAGRIRSTPMNMFTVA